MSKKIIIDLEANTSKAQSELKDILKELKALNKQATETNQSLESGFKDVEKTTKSAGKSLFSFSKILKGTLIIKAISAAFDFFKETLGKNQVVVDLFATTFEALSIAFNDFINFIFNNVGGVVNAFKSIFQDPVQSLIDFKDALVEGVINRFNELVETLGFVAKGIGNLFKGNFKDAVESFKQAGRESIDIITGQDESFEKVKETLGNVVDATKNYITETVNAAKANVELEKTANKAAVANQGLIEKYDLQAEAQRQIRDEERNTIEKRIEANEKLAEILDKQEEQMRANAKAIVAQAQVQFNKIKNDENEIALMEAKNELAAVEAQIAGFRSEQLANDLALNREKLELETSIKDAEAERQIAQRDFNAEQIENEYLRLQAQQAALAIEKEQEEQRLQEKRDLYKEGTQAYADAQNELLAYQQDSANRQKQIEKDLAKAKEQEITNALGNIANIVGQNSKFGKGIAVVSAIRDTYAGASKALAQGGIFGAIQAAAIIATGLRNVKQITSTPDPAPPSFARGAGGGGGQAIATPSAPPAFNVVGASGANQLATAIAGQQEQPVKAFVVSGDVSTAQELDRNIVQGAAIG